MFFAALMVLSVFAMSAAFAGGAAAAVDTVSVADVDLVDGNEATIEVTHDDGNTNVYAVIDVNDNGDYNESTDILVSEESATGTSTNLTTDVSGLDGGDYDVYAVSGTDSSVAPSDGDDISSASSTTFTLSDSTPTGSISGTVTDAADEPVDGATVEVEGTELSATTDANGDYTIDEAPDGEHTVVASTAGLAPSSQTIEVSNGEPTENVDFSLSEYGVEQSTVFEGEDVSATVPSDAEVELRSGDVDDSSFVSELNNDDGTVTIDTEGLEGDYVLQVDGEESEDYTFEVAVQTLDAEFDPDSVVEGDDASSELVLDSNRLGYEVEVSSEDLSDSDLEDIFASADSATEDGTVILSSGDTDANFSGIDAGEYNFTIEATDTAAETNASIEVTESVDADASFDSSTYSEEAGDIAEFTVEMTGDTETATVDIVEEEENYNATIDVTDGDGDGEVTVYFNTYLAGNGDNAGAFYTADESEDSVSYTEDAEFGDDQRLLPANFDMELSLGEDDVALATLTLLEGSVNDASTGIAPKDAEWEDNDVEDLLNATTERNTVAEEDYLVFGFDASGIFGHLEAEGVNSENSNFNLQIEQTNDRYGSPQDLASDEYTLVEDPENDRFFVVIDSEAYGMEDGEEYEITFEATNDYVYFEDSQSVSTDASVVDRMV